MTSLASQLAGSWTFTMNRSPLRLVRCLHACTTRRLLTTAASPVSAPLNSAIAARVCHQRTPARGAICRQALCYPNIHQQHRCFSSGPGGSDPETDIKGFIFHVPNPFTWFKNKLIVFVIHKKVDPTFSLQEFLSGATQAMCLLTQLVSCNDYDRMSGLLETKAIESVRNHLSDWSLEQQQILEIQPENIQMAVPKINNFLEFGRSYCLHIEVLFLALKRHKDRAFMLEYTLRFTRSYDVESASDWMISDVDKIKVRELQPPKSN